MYIYMYAIYNSLKAEIKLEILSFGERAYIYINMFYFTT